MVSKRSAFLALLASMASGAGAMAADLLGRSDPLPPPTVFQRFYLHVGPAGLF